MSKDFEIGGSAVLNQTGNRIGLQNTTGHLSLFAPDFNWRGAFNANSKFEFEGGAIWGEQERQGQDAQKFNGFDLTGRFIHMFQNANTDLGGVEGWELAAGFSWLDTDTGVSDNDNRYFRAGPALYFGKRIRLQCNGEWTLPGAADNIFVLRSQANVSF